MESINLFWHRRDLRLEDNAGLYHALKNGQHPVVPLFIFDKKILDDLEDKDDARVTFIHDHVTALQQQLADLGSAMLVRYGHPAEIFQELIQEYSIQTVYTNRDYEPYAKERDASVQELLASHSIDFLTFKDQIIFEKEEVRTGNDDVYTVFTPYSRKWKEKLSSRMDKAIGANGTQEPMSYYLKSYPNEKYFDHFWKGKLKGGVPSLEEMGFQRSSLAIPDKKVTQGLIRKYDQQRNFPAVEGTSRLGIHFRFGTISIREKARKAQTLNETFLNELIWRDFYAQILDAFPHVVNGPFREKYQFIKWSDNEDHFQRWCEGKTGYPIVDAGMRELNETGFMHNRVRMITASFLTKHLLIDWRWGEAYFARKLLDFELASNNGGWQWAAGSGTDAAPYFRVFNPYSQQKKFDKDFQYIRKWVPEFESSEYPDPIVEHKWARERCLEEYKRALAEADERLA
jgi:deoxyribodipyrimidine photo-lyase